MPEDVLPPPAPPLEPLTPKTVEGIAPGRMVTVPMAAPTGPQPDAARQPTPVAGEAQSAPVPAAIVAVSTVHWWEDRAFLSMAAAVVIDIAIEIDRLATTGTLSWHSAVPIVLGVLASRFRKTDNTVLR